MLVPHGRGRRGVPQPRHQFGDTGTCRGCQYRTTVAQIVPAQNFPPGLAAGFIPVPIQRGRLQMAAIIRLKHERITLAAYKFRQVVLYLRDYVRRDGDVSDTGVTLGCGGAVGTLGAAPPRAESG